MPEYVCAVAPHIHTQEAADSTRIGWSDISAANPEEIVRVHDIRKWYLSELGRFWPLWLLEQPGEEDITVPDVLQAWEKYESICDMLNCRFQEDRIRAIYPLMFRVPVENHEELVKLVDAVARALEARKPDHPGSQIAREHHRLIAEASLKGNHNLEIDELSSVKSVPFQGIESFFSILAGLSTKFSMTE